MREQWKSIKPNILNWRVVLGSILLAIIGFGNALSGKYLVPYIYGTRVTPDDLFFRFFNFQSWAFNLPTVVQNLFVLLFIIFLLRHKFKNLDIYIWGFVIMYALRIVVNLMTPFALPEGIIYSGIDNDSIWWDSGYFFSGHTAFFTMVWAYTRKEARIFNYTGIVLLIIGIITILLGRHHYTIDIYGGLLTGLFVYDYFVKPRLKS